MSKQAKSASELHENVPPDWYYRSIKENLLQRYWHRRRFEEVGRLIEPTGGKILDIGCADGTFTKFILEKSKAEQIIGIDALKSSVKWAKEHWKSKKMKFLVEDAHKLNFKSGSFDAVFALEVLEHVFEPVKVLKEIKRVVKVGGYAILLVPTESLLFRIVWFIWGFYRGKIWKETHIHAYRNDYLVKLSEQVGFKVEANKKFLLGMLQIVKVRK
ncbi:class I SAM-dependent methyltransferase [Patescibacteria group bacterium]|nr:class I SAM-dependent methyltransferase [Patescibacteria group bacterium]